VGQGEEGEVIMHRYEEDGMEELGWLVAMLMALGFLFFALVYFLHWAVRLCMHCTGQGG
jgi:hypothetical protein